LLINNIKAKTLGTILAFCSVVIVLGLTLLCGRKATNARVEITVNPVVLDGSREVQITIVNHGPGSLMFRSVDNIPEWTLEYEVEGVKVVANRPHYTGGLSRIAPGASVTFTVPILERAHRIRAEFSAFCSGGVYDLLYRMKLSLNATGIRGRIGDLLRLPSFEETNFSSGWFSLESRSNAFVPVQKKQNAGQ